MSGGTIAGLGEEGIIRIISEAAGPLALNLIGDDAARLTAMPQGEELLVTVDALIEGVHFRRDRSSARQLALKTVAVNLSDIAAMGGQPLYCFLTLGLPGDLKREWVEDFANGLREALQPYDIILAGGDTTSAAAITITLTLIGAATAGRAVKRSGGREGDALILTGYPGRARAGLRLLDEEEYTREKFPNLLNALHEPRALLYSGLAAADAGASAMIDISDGLMTDLGRLCRMSGLGAELSCRVLPVDEELAEFCRRFDIDPIAFLLAGGEDYELLIACPPGRVADVIDSIKREGETTARRIGRLRAEPGIGLEGVPEGFEVDEPYRHFG